MSFILLPRHFESHASFFLLFLMQFEVKAKGNEPCGGGGGVEGALLNGDTGGLAQILKTYGNPPFEAPREQLRRLQDFSLFTFRPPHPPSSK